jgi:hypothetical protein
VPFLRGDDKDVLKHTFARAGRSDWISGTDKELKLFLLRKGEKLGLAE